MTRAIAVRREGDAYQARIFWRKAVCLLDPDSPVIRVGFESGPKGFDDVWVEYAPGRGPIEDVGGFRLLREHIQCKWHVSVDEYGHADLVDPEFINANSISLLQRAYTAHCTHAKDGNGIRFKLLTNWHIKQTDALRKLIYQKSKTLRLDDLFATKTDNSATGQIRKLWREHLDIDDDALRIFAGTLSLDTDSTSLNAHRDNLDPFFEMRGLRRIPPSESSFSYDDLAFQWLGQGRLEFNKQSFRDACKDEGLFETTGKTHVVFGVKSFEHAFDRLEDRCADVLNLVPNFNERAIRDEADWAVTIYPKLQIFLQAAARNNPELRLALDTHATLAFAAGSIINIKSGRSIELEQRTITRQIWHPNDINRDPAWSTWICETEHLNENPEIAVAVSLTHDVSSAVRAFLAGTVHEVGKLLILYPSGGPGVRAVASGEHAFDLAEALARRINDERKVKSATTHLFIAGPNAFTFFIGQRQSSLGKIILYEYDFEGENGGSYQVSLSLN